MRTSSEVRNAVLGAFFHEREAGRPAVGCYTAGVSAWRTRFPDHQGRYAAKHAVTLMLDATMQLRVPEPRPRRSAVTDAEHAAMVRPAADVAKALREAIENEHRTKT
jgi:hypothetical protein